MWTAAIAVVELPSTRRRKSLRSAIPPGTPVTYLLCDRNAEQKLPTPRTTATTNRIMTQHRSFRGQLSMILDRDGLPTRIVCDPQNPSDIRTRIAQRKLSQAA